MAHANAHDLADLKVLLEGIRSLGSLKEKSLGCFYLKNKGVLHFHTKDGRRYAHVFDGKRWHEVDIKTKPTKAAQSNILGELVALLPLDAPGSVPSTIKPYKVGQKIAWKWVGSLIHGEILEVFMGPIEKEIKGKRIKRNGSVEKPAYLVKSVAGNFALKLHTELVA